MSVIGNILGAILVVAFLVLCVSLYFMLIGATLFVGAIGGAFIGVVRAFKNYFSALKDNLRARQ